MIRDAEANRLERVVKLLATHIARAELAAHYDPPAGLTLTERFDRVAELNDLWRMTEAVGLADRVRLRIQLNPHLASSGVGAAPTPPPTEHQRDSSERGAA